MRLQTIRWIVVGIGLAAAVRPVAAQDDALPAIDKSINAWIADLDSEIYEVRERATRHLARHGHEYLDELAAAADGQRPEAAARAIVALEALAETDDDRLKLAVLVRLTDLVHRRDASLRAQAKLAGASLPIVLKMGGRLEPTVQFVDETSGQLRSTKIILGPDWTGGDEGLIHVSRLDFVYSVSLRRTPVTTDGIAQLERMPSLMFLELFGVDAKEEEVQQLQQTLANVNFDIRSGAMLGVRGTVGAPVAQIQQVEPDSAAEMAGLQQGDIIIKVDDAEVSSFTELTAQIAKQQPGEQAMLTLLRNDQPIEREVTFGYWE